MDDDYEIIEPDGEPETTPSCEGNDVECSGNCYSCQYR